MTPDASHQPVLFEVIKKTKEPILELGAGVSSTQQIHELAVNRNILTIDDNKEWAFKYADLRNDHHRFMYLRTEDSEWYFNNDNAWWCIVFIDNSTWRERLLAIEKYKDTADYVIIHDSQFMTTSCYFNHWREFAVKNESELPHTLLGSNKYQVNKFKIDMEVIDESL